MPDTATYQLSALDRQLIARQALEDLPDKSTQKARDAFAAFAAGDYVRTERLCGEAQEWAAAAAHPILDYLDQHASARRAEAGGGSVTGPGYYACA